jgi:DNA-3-methyladenine glycosylase
MRVDADLFATRLDRAFYARDALVVARALVGCHVVHASPQREHLRIARIVETEAYRGPKDLACHARAGLTKRTRALLGEAGHAYVFFIYGMHDCFNVVCGGVGRGHAVLVRAGEPVSGFTPVSPATGFASGARLSGPGLFARAMGITRALDGHDLTREPLYLVPRSGRRPSLVVTPRVGVAYSGEWADKPYRFYDAKSTHVSKPSPSAIGRKRG